MPKKEKAFLTSKIYQTIWYHQKIITNKKSCTVHFKLQANQKEKRKKKQKTKEREREKKKPNPPFLKFECNYMNKDVVFLVIAN